MTKGTYTVGHVSDQKYFRSADGKWYTTASIHSYLNKGFRNVDKWVFFGRLYDVENTVDLHEIDLNMFPVVEFNGTWNQKPGIAGYVEKIFEIIHLLRILVIHCDVIYLKFSFIMSYIAGLLVNQKKIVVTHLVGDIEAVKLTKDSYIASTVIFIQKIVYRYIVAKKADAQIYVSKNLMNKYGAGKSKRFVINESRMSLSQIVDINDIAGRENESELKVLFVGRISPEKGLDFLLNSIVQRSYITLGIVGSGSQLPYIKDKVLNLGISDRVHFLGQISWGEKLFNVIRGHHCLILPSLTEGLPLVIIEAMCLGVCVMGTCVGGIPELIKDGDNGILFGVDDSNRLIYSLDRLYYNDELRLMMIRNALKTVREFTIETQMSILKNALDELGIT